MIRNERRYCHDGHSDENGYAPVNYFQGTNQIAHFLLLARQHRETRHFTGQCRTYSHIQNDKYRLKRGKNTDQSIGFNTHEFDIERNKYQPHKGLPNAPGKIGSDIFLY